MLLSTVLFGVLLWLNQGLLVKITELKDFPILVRLSIFIILMDALSAIPFAKIRNEGRPRLYAIIKIIGIFLYIGLTAFFVMYCPDEYNKNGGNSWVVLFYSPRTNPIVYVLIANMAQSAVTLLLLLKWLLPKKFEFSFPIWKEMIIYAFPMLIAGLGYTVNETFDRLMLGWWLPPAIAKDQVGIYNACYKLAILISLFIQAFRMGAEPYFL